MSKRPTPNTTGFHHHQPGVRGAPARAIHAHRPRRGPGYSGTTAGQALLPSGIPREEIYGPLPLPRRNSLQTALDKVLRRRRNLHRLLPDRPLQPQADARSRRGRPSGGHAAPDPVRKRAGAHDLHLRRGDRPRLPGPGPGLRIDARGDAADRRRRADAAILIPSQESLKDFTPRSASKTGRFRSFSKRRTTSTSARAIRNRIGLWSGAATTAHRCPNVCTAGFSDPAKNRSAESTAGRLEASGRTFRSFRTPASARSDPKIPLFRRRSDRLSTKSTKKRRNHCKSFVKCLILLD